MVRISELDASRLAFYGQPGVDTDSALAAHLVEQVRASAGDRACQPGGPPVAQATLEGWRSYRWTLRCPRPDPISVHVDLLFDVAPSHLHFARFVDSDRTSGITSAAVGARGPPDGDRDEVPVERVLTADSRDWPLPRAGVVADAAGTRLAAYVLLGIRHILGGYDHLAFVLGLVLLAGSFREVAELVTAFTVAHSLTLAMAILGIARPDSAAVEALIGFSIALVAIENVWLLDGGDRWLPPAVLLALMIPAALSVAGIGRLATTTCAGLLLFSWCHFRLLAIARSRALVRAVVAFCFGLVHGFGFAGVLAGVGMPPGRTAAALFGFNVGVEIGQLAVIALVWPLLGYVSRRWRADLLAEIGSAAIAGLGTFWFLARAFG